MILKGLEEEGSGERNGSIFKRNVYDTACMHRFRVASKMILRTYCAKFVGVSGVNSFRPSSVFITLLYRRRRPAAVAAAATAGHLLTCRRVSMGSAVGGGWTAAGGHKLGNVRARVYLSVCVYPRARLYVYTAGVPERGRVCISYYYFSTRMVPNKGRHHAWSSGAYAYSFYT